MRLEVADSGLVINSGLGAAHSLDADLRSLANNRGVSTLIEVSTLFDRG
jgi:hypothetical protein